MTGATGIVLAGGRSTRFGSDKLAALIDGTTLLEHSIRSLAAVCDEVIVVEGHGSPGHGSPGHTSAQSQRVRVIHDPQPDGGPLVGFLAGLEAASNPTAIVAGGDMPQLQPDVLRLLLTEVAAGAAAASLEQGARRQPLPCAVHCNRALPAARALLAKGRTSLTGLLDALDAVALPESTWRAVDPDGRTLVDVDRPGDLERLSRPGEPRC